jgi:hypothetical protein
MNICIPFFFANSTITQISFDHLLKVFRGMGSFMVFNATFNNISLWSVLLVEEIEVPGENH